VSPIWNLLVVEAYGRDGRAGSIEVLPWAHVEAGRCTDVMTRLERLERQEHALAGT
jgi:hypothetical protein